MGLSSTLLGKVSMLNYPLISQPRPILDLDPKFESFIQSCGNNASRSDRIACRPHVFIVLVFAGVILPEGALRKVNLKWLHGGRLDDYVMWLVVVLDDAVFVDLFGNLDCMLD